MKSSIFYHKRTGSPVQIIARAQTKPTFQDVICYQELTKPYDYFVMEKMQFLAEYVKEFIELPLGLQKQIAKRDDLPNRQPRISRGEIFHPQSGEEETGEKEQPEIKEEPEIKEKPKATEEPAENADTADESGDPKIQKLIEFFDAPTYYEKIKLFEKMGNILDEHILNSIAVSLDLSIEDGMDGYKMIMSELRMRSKYENGRGDRL